MNAVIFVAVMCIADKCDFISSNQSVTEAHCEQIKKDFFALPFKKEVTLVAAQCMPFAYDKKVKI